MKALALFRDVDGDQYYKPLAGDYAEFNLDNSRYCSTRNFLSGNQSLWYAFNDLGNTHGE